MKRLTSFIKRAGSALALAMALLFPAINSVEANDIMLFQTFFNTDFVVAGVGGMRNVGNAGITLSGVSGTVTKAYLYWHGPTNSSDPNANGSVLVNAIPVTGTNIGFSNDNCWDFANSQAYRADVTSIVSGTGNGAYSLTGFGASSINTNGASLVVFFNDGNPGNNRDIVLFDGNDSNIPNSFDANGWNVTLSGINYTSGTAALHLHVADGQDFLDDALVLNSTTLVPSGAIFQGTSVPSANRGPSGNGSLWDIKSFSVTSFLSPGLNTLTLSTGVNSDCLALVVAVVDLPAGAAPGFQINLSPQSSQNCTGTQHTVTATIKDSNNAPGIGKTVNFQVTSGPNTGTTGSAVTDSNGNASFTYTGSIVGTDVIEACFTSSSNAAQCATATKEWMGCNQPPDTTNSVPSISCIWPPSHQFTNITILGVTDPDGDPLTITVTSITSDEPTATIKGAGGVTHAPDAMGVGTSTARLRAERSGLGDGRVYEISFIADDGKGGKTPGKVSVKIPRDIRGRSCIAIDNGQNYDATQ